MLRQGGYALWNASLAWTSPQQHWNVVLRGDNLGDRSYRNIGFAYPPQLGIVTGYYGPPRTWSLTLTHAFQRHGRQSFSWDFTICMKTECHRFPASWRP